MSRKIRRSLVGAFWFGMTGWSWCASTAMTPHVTPTATADAAADPAARLALACAKAEACLARPDLSAYRGWIKFLEFEARIEAARSGMTGETTAAKVGRLDDWVQRIGTDPGMLASLRGVQEWAYESPVDGSGQPFKLVIPTDYDSSHPAPLSVYMHGSGGNHLEHATTMVAHPGSFEMAVLGRARDGGYHGLSEADVLHAIDYVESHWTIDPSRVSLRGGSMGGGGTYFLGARYPQRWAAGRPSCGFASEVPMGNLVTLPIYATHSADDWAVSILHERGPLAWLREHGGQVIFDETDGYGHEVWNYQEGNKRGAAWLGDKVRPDSRTVRRIDYTALDGAAVRGWWAEITEWGAAPARARFVLTAGEPNALFAQLTNIARLRLNLAESPFDAGRPLQVSINGMVPIVLPAPLPPSVVLAGGDDGWKFEAVVESRPYRLHTPGSATLLYDGEPLLIVYGTNGTEVERRAMRLAAEAASRGSSPAWPDDSGEAGPEGVPNSQNLYGRLNIKADREVAAADLAACHLVLIGTAGQNSVVARMADALPVRLVAGDVVCSDGVRIRDGSLAFGLVYYNPLAPRKLVFWVASADPAAYAAGSLIPRTMAGGHVFGSNAFGADLLVMPPAAMTLVAARSFDSQWHWVPGRDASPLLGDSYRSAAGLSAGVAAALRRATGADLALVEDYGATAPDPIAVGVTRVSDLAPLFANIPVGVIDLPGAEIREMGRSFAMPEAGICLPGFDPANIEPARRYRVALPVNTLWKFAALLKIAPRGYQWTDLDTADAIERFLPAK